jgi:hypothetical protein
MFALAYLPWMGMSVVMSIVACMNIFLFSIIMICIFVYPISLCKWHVGPHPICHSLTCYKWSLPQMALCMDENSPVLYYCTTCLFESWGRNLSFRVIIMYWCFWNTKYKLCHNLCFDIGKETLVYVYSIHHSESYLGILDICFLRHYMDLAQQMESIVLINCTCWNYLIIHLKGILIAGLRLLSSSSFTFHMDTRRAVHLHLYWLLSVVGSSLCPGFSRLTYSTLLVSSGKSMFYTPILKLFS